MAETAGDLVVETFKLTKIYQNRGQFVPVTEPGHAPAPGPAGTRAARAI